MSDCKNWRNDVLKKYRKGTSPFATVAKPEYVPNLYQNEWESWRVLPEIGYDADVTKLYDMTGLETALQTHPCALEEAQAKALSQAQNEGVAYPSTFYWGLAMAGAGVALVLLKGGR